MTYDGSEDHWVKPQGLLGYAPPPPGTWDPKWDPEYQPDLEELLDADGEDSDDSDPEL